MKFLYQIIFTLIPLISISQTKSIGAEEKSEIDTLKFAIGQLFGKNQQNSTHKQLFYFNGNFLHTESIDSSFKYFNNGYKYYKGFGGGTFTEKSTGRIIEMVDNPYAFNSLRNFNGHSAGCVLIFFKINDTNNAYDIEIIDDFLGDSLETKLFRYELLNLFKNIDFDNSDLKHTSFFVPIYYDNNRLDFNISERDKYLIKGNKKNKSFDYRLRNYNRARWSDNRFNETYFKIGCLHLEEALKLNQIIKSIDEYNKSSKTKFYGFDNSILEYEKEKLIHLNKAMKNFKICLYTNNNYQDYEAWNKLSIVYYLKNMILDSKICLWLSGNIEISNLNNIDFNPVK